MINWLSLGILLLGGLALFLYGMEIMTDGLKLAAGRRLKDFLRRMTRNRWTSFLAGTGITAVIQSSSVTTVLAVGFVSAGLLSFQSTVGLILGANVGTTITAQIIAFKITKAAWGMVVVGYLLSFLLRKKMAGNFGRVILGLGLVFLGMNAMSEATEPLRSYEPFIDLMKGLDSPILGVLIGALFTAAVQSSSATTGIVIILASQQMLSLEAGISIILGANIGTCVTAVLSAIGKPREAMRVALSHVLINVIGALIWLLFIDQLATVVRLIPATEARRIAHAHTLFNVVNTFLFIGWVGPFSRLVLWMIPERRMVQERIFPELDHFYLDSPSLAIDLVASATRKLGRLTIGLLKDGLEQTLTGDENVLLHLRAHDRKIDRGQMEVLAFIQQIQTAHLSSEESRKVEILVEVVNLIEAAADVLTTTLVEAAEHRIREGFEVSDETQQKLSHLYGFALRAFEEVFTADSTAKSGNGVDKERFMNAFHEVRAHLLRRLAVNEDKRIALFRFESEVLEAIRRLHALARRLGRKVVTSDGKLFDLKTGEQQ